MSPPPAPPPAEGGLLSNARRLAEAGAQAASRKVETVSNVVSSAVNSARDLTGQASQKVGAAVSQALPDAATVKANLGRALVLGGKALMDPQAVVGSLALDLGQRLSSGQTEPLWLALVADDQGFGLLARGDEVAVRLAADQALAAQRSVLVCKVMAALSPGPPPDAVR